MSMCREGPRPHPPPYTYPPFTHLAMPRHLSQHLSKPHMVPIVCLSPSLHMHTGAPHQGL
jgi:hypothetical protein